MELFGLWETKASLVEASLFAIRQKVAHQGNPLGRGGCHINKVKKENLVGEAPNFPGVSIRNFVFIFDSVQNLAKSHIYKKGL